MQHIVIDINQSLWRNVFQEGDTIKANLEFVNKTSANLAPINKNEPTHLAYDLMDTGTFLYPDIIIL